MSGIYIGEPFKIDGIEFTVGDMIEAGDGTMYLIVEYLSRGFVLAMTGEHAGSVFSGIGEASDWGRWRTVGSIDQLEK